MCSGGRLASALGEAGDELAPWPERAPRINEVAHAAALMSRLLAVAATTGLPLALYKLRAVAGPKLMLDRFGY